MKLFAERHNQQRFTLVRNPKTNGKAERVIKTLIELWYDKTRFNSSAHRKTEFKRLLNFYNGVRPHNGIGGLTPEEKLIKYLYPEKL